MAQRLRVTYQDDRIVEVLVQPKAMVQVERHYQVSLADDSTRRLEHVYFLAWAALHYSGREGNDFENFLGLVAEVEDITGEADEPDPTRLAPGPAGSSVSASLPGSPSPL